MALFGLGQPQPSFSAAWGGTGTHFVPRRPLRAAFALRSCGGSFHCAPYAWAIPAALRRGLRAVWLSHVYAVPALPANAPWRSMQVITFSLSFPWTPPKRLLEHPTHHRALLVYLHTSHSLHGALWRLSGPLCRPGQSSIAAEAATRTRRPKDTCRSPAGTPHGIEPRPGSDPASGAWAHREIPHRQPPHTPFCT